MLSKAQQKTKSQSKGGALTRAPHKQQQLSTKKSLSTRKAPLSTKAQFTSPHQPSSEPTSPQSLQITPTSATPNGNLINSRKTKSTPHHSAITTSSRHFRSTHPSSTTEPAPQQPPVPPPAPVQPSSQQTGSHILGDGKAYQRSRTNLVEVINGRSKRWLYDPRTPNRKLHPQWMWHSDEDTFHVMLASGKGRFQSTYHDVINTARSFAYSVLLPAGFPDSVHACYPAFSTWQFVETSFNQFIHVLCSQAMLSCVGLPTDAGTTAGGAVAIRWIAKDGIAHFSKLFFTKKYAYQLDFRPKTWGLVSEMLFIFGSAFELSTAILAKYGLPEFFLPLAALGASLQSVAHLAWEATHATFNKYLSLRNNLADVTAKADSQMVMSELLGMSLGLFYINYFNEPWHLWAAFLCAIPLHLGSTICRLHAIKFGKLSSSRLLQHYNSYVQHRLGPTKLNPGVTPEEYLGATAEAIHPDIYSDKTKRIEFITKKMASNAQLVAEFDAQRANSTIQPAVRMPQQSTPTPPAMAKIATDGAPTPTTSPQQQQKQAAAIQEIQAIQQLMSFATPEQFHHTDIRLGEWFDTKTWVDVYGYPQIKMCASIDEAFETEHELFGAVSLFKDKHYLVNYRPTTKTIYLAFEEECEHDDLMQSLLVATRLAYDIRKHGMPLLPEDIQASSDPNSSNPEDLAKRWAPYNMIRESLQWSLRYEDQITALLADCDWDVDELTWPDTGARVYWEIFPEAQTTPATPPPTPKM